MTKEELKAIMAIAFSQYPEVVVTQPRFDAWWMHCEAIGIDLGKKALNLLTTKKTFGPPKIADFLECVKQIQDAENPQKQITDGDAWGAVMKAVAKWGYVNERNALADLHAFDPKISQTVQNFGWRTICEGDASQNNTLRAQFLKSWHSLRNRQDLFEELRIQTILGPNLLTEGPKSLPFDFEKAISASGGSKSNA